MTKNTSTVRLEPAIAIREFTDYDGPFAKTLAEVPSGLKPGQETSVSPLCDQNRCLTAIVDELWALETEDHERPGTPSPRC